MCKVFCANCNMHIYNIKETPLNGDIIKAANFIPANKNIKQPESGELFLCPYCNEFFLFDKWLLTDKGILP